MLLFVTLFSVAVRVFFLFSLAICAIPPSRPFVFGSFFLLRGGKLDENTDHLRPSSSPVSCERH